MAAGISLHAISQYELGNKGLKSETVERLADVLDLDRPTRALAYLERAQQILLGAVNEQVRA
jgi:hypothetical protein